jgi:hypothetical protein|tara:strand:- start:478 stop:1311 length:834 start_codon:yes stop_codon:yes gene_type:complete
MKTINVLRSIAVNVFAIVGIAVTSLSLYASDNEVLLDQQGDNLILTILQAGYGNQISATATAGAGDLVVTGGNLIIDIIQDGNSNKFYGDLLFDGSGSSVMDFYQLGSSNVWDLQIGVANSGDNTDMLVDIQGDANIFDVDIGGNATAENTNFDLDILGSRNDFTTSFTNSRVWASASGTNSVGGIISTGTGSSAMSGIQIDTSNAVWNMEITGDDNAFATKQSGNGGHSLTVVLAGSDGDFQFTQDMTATCSPTCEGIININLDSENASVSIKQTD